MNEKPPTIVQFANAASGPPVDITKANIIGMPEMKFMVCLTVRMYVAKIEVQMTNGECRRPVLKKPQGAEEFCEMLESF
ncbi:hypothetical protein THARTR1_10967 [Trichoderma harzianum]|uniref:Uncharacterized protein n=1 Tax=Trichoderma harzianum TaxID=5544 RepID=A0A2K0TI78_TRIHA|nr:hypothetical protein THARTR1_10967 [Trichoderma harzianum]